MVVSGAGIAGPTLSYWLSRSGYRVIVVEVAPGIRPGGQTVDLRGIGGAVVERMGLLELMRAGPRSARSGVGEIGWHPARRDAGDSV